MLLIEDNGDAREMLRTMLEDARHVVYDAVDFEHHLSSRLIEIGSLVP